MRVLYTVPGWGPNAMMDNDVVVGKMLSKRCNLFLFARADNEYVKAIDSKGIYTYYLRKKEPKSYVGAWRMRGIRQYVSDNGIDIVFSQSNKIDLFTWPHLSERPKVVYLHDPFPHDGVPPVRRMIEGLGRNLYLNNADEIIVSSYAMRNAFLKRYSPRKAKVSVIRLGVLENLKFERNVVESDIDVLFFGRIEDYKGLGVLFEAAGWLPNRNIVIIGKGNAARYAPNGCLPGNVNHIDSYVSDRELAEYVQRSKLVVMPYISATGTQVIQTANYYGKPVVASKVGGLPEYIVDDVTGVLTEPGNAEMLAAAISELLQSPSRLQSMGDAAREYVEAECDAEVLAEQYISVFNRVHKSY